MTLREYVMEGVERGADQGYHATRYLSMQERCRTQADLIALITKLVATSDPKSGFSEMQKRGLAKWSLEGAVLEFPQMFSPLAVAYARERIRGSLDQRRAS